nr:hypothetical protein [Tanacetum cinerariifolium]
MSISKFLTVWLDGMDNYSPNETPLTSVSVIPVHESRTSWNRKGESLTLVSENTGYWQETNLNESPVEQVATSSTKNKKKATRNRQKRTSQSVDAPRQTPWTTEEENALAKGWLAISENIKDGYAKKQAGFWCEESGAGDEDYVQRAMLHYEIEIGIPFKLRHCWEIFKDQCEEASINLNNNVGDNDKDEVKEIRRPEGRDKARGVGKNKV